MANDKGRRYLLRKENFRDPAGLSAVRIAADRRPVHNLPGALKQEQPAFPMM
jgi:hypothetical protein